MFIQLQTLPNSPLFCWILIIIGLLNFAAICRKGPERVSGDQKKNRNGVPVRSGSKRTLLQAYYCMDAMDGYYQRLDRNEQWQTGAGNVINSWQKVVDSNRANDAANRRMEDT